MNELLNKISLLSEIAHNAYESVWIEVDILFVKLSNENIDTFELRLKEYSIKFDKNGVHNLEIELQSISNKVHFSVNEDIFLQDSNFTSNIFIEKNIAILCYKESFLFYDFNTTLSYIGNNQVKDNFLIENAKSYLIFRDFLYGGEFADYYNFSNDQIVFYTGSKGVYKLTYPKIPIKLDSSVDFSKVIIHLIEQLKNKDYSIHFKNSLFGLEKSNGISQINTFFEHLSSLIQETDNNYQLQLKNFSFDKLSNDLKKEKEKYFSSLREILNKIFSQIIGVPISIAASTFASYKVENKFILCLILMAFGAYVFFAIYLQTIYKKDTEEVEKDFNKDFDKVLKNSGLPENDIEHEKDKIKRRIKNIKNTILAFKISVIILAFLFFIFIINQLITPQNKDDLKTITIKTKYANILLDDSLMSHSKIRVKINSSANMQKRKSN